MASLGAVPVSIQVDMWRSWDLESMSTPAMYHWGLGRKARDLLRWQKGQVRSFLVWRVKMCLENSLIPENLPIDWMHCVCEGILKRQLFHRWFGEAFSGEDYSLSRFTELDDIFCPMISLENHTAFVSSSIGKPLNFVCLFFLLDFLVFSKRSFQMYFLLNNSITLLFSWELCAICMVFLCLLPLWRRLKSCWTTL